MRKNESGAPIDILLVEDSPGDILLTMEAFAEAGVKVRLHVAEDGVEALDYLHRRGRHTAANRPDLILLDLNLPRMDGHEVLGFIKATDGLKRIPVIVLTTSNARADIEQAYEAHANCYITKPVDLDDLLAVIKGVESFWLGTVQLPPV